MKGKIILRNILWMIKKEQHIMKLEEYLEIECNNNDRFFECMHGYIYAIPQYNVYQQKCNVQEECCCVGCNNFVSKITKTEIEQK